MVKSGGADAFGDGLFEECCLGLFEFGAQLNHDGFSCFELTYEQAIAYLRKEAITLDASVPRGYILLTYKNIPLGFAKNIGNRANNLYPQEWRIRSGYLPEELSFVC